MEFGLCMLVLLALAVIADGKPRRNPCPYCWETDREKCRQHCDMYAAWRRSENTGGNG